MEKVDLSIVKQLLQLYSNDMKMVDEVEMLLHEDLLEVDEETQVVHVSQLDDFLEKREVSDFLLLLL